MKNPKILFMPTNSAPVNFWRMFQFWKKMKEKGLDAFIYNFRPEEEKCGRWEFSFVNDKDETLRNEVYGLMNRADIIVMGYIHHPKILALIDMFQDHFKKKILCEIDDQIIDLPEFNPAYKLGHTPGSGMEKLVIEQMKLSNGIITTNTHLAELYERFNTNIHIIPNCIDFKFWNTPKMKPPRIRVGWIGGGNHDGDLEVMKQVIPLVLEKYPDIEFVFVHGIPEYLKIMAKKEKRIKLIAGPRSWATIDKYPQFVAKQGFSIGLAPLMSHSFNYSKSNLRWLEYSALRIPTVATNIKPYSNSIVHRKTGLLCDSVSDWVENIGYLIENQSKRIAMGDDAHISCMDYYNLDKITDKYIKVLKGL